MRKGKILVISTHLDGGCFHYSNEIISYFPKSEVEIVMPDIQCEPCNIKPNWTIKYYKHSHLIKLISFIYSLVRILTGALTGKYSSMILFSISPWDYYFLKLWKLVGKPSYVVIHDGKMHVGEVDKKFQNHIIQMMRWTTHLIFLSEYVRNLVHDNFGIDKPYLIAPHGLIDYGNQRKTARIEEKPNLLFLGRVSKYKGVDLLLSAIDKVPSNLYSKLVIAGKWNYKNVIQYNKEKVEIIDKWLSDQDILNCISECDIMIFPYLEATQSGVATLAINYLKPSVVTRVGAFAEQFDEDSVVFTEPQVEKLANAISNLLENPSKIQQMKQSLVTLRAKYSWKQISTDLYESIRNNNGINTVL